MPDSYYYMDINLIDRIVLKYGESTTASHTGDTRDVDVHRVFLTKGQYNKLIKKVEALQHRGPLVP